MNTPLAKSVSDRLALELTKLEHQFLSMAELIHNDR
jgi:hypothetical protein